MSNTYMLKNNVLKIYTKMGVKDFCRDNKIRIENFDMPVHLDDVMVDCSEMFRGCNAFNQSVNIPISARNCDYMFYDCTCFNQPVAISENVTSCYAMFMNCRAFNQDIIVPSNVEICSYMFANCSSLTYPAHKPNGAKFWKMHIGCNKRIIKQPFISPQKLELSKAEIVIPVGETRLVSAKLFPAKCSAEVKFVIEKIDVADIQTICFEKGTDYRCNITGKQAGKTVLYAVTDKNICTACIIVK